MSDLQGPVRLHFHWAMKVIAMLEIVLFPVAAYRYWQRGLFITSLGTILLALLAVWVFFLADTKIDVDEKELRITAPHGVYVMDWAEVKSFDLRGTVVTLFGDGKAITYNLLLAGEGKRKFKDFVARVIEQRLIPRGRPASVTNSQIQKMMRKTKVRGLKLF